MYSIVLMLAATVPAEHQAAPRAGCAGVAARAGCQGIAARTSCAGSVQVQYVKSQATGCHGGAARFGTRVVRVAAHVRHNAAPFARMPRGPEPVAVFVESEEPPRAGLFARLLAPVTRVVVRVRER